MRYAMWLIYALFLLFVLFALWVRLAPLDPAAWHVDPDAVTKSWKPNQYLLSRAPSADGPPVADPRAPEEVARAIEQVALSRPRTKRIAGSPEALWMTYVQRSMVMDYPDYISVKITPAEDRGSLVSIYSRSRYGRYDFQVNRMRVESWLQQLRASAEG